MNYLVIEQDGQKILPANELRNYIDAGAGKIRIFRLCGMNDPLELFLRWFGNCFIVEDKYGNMEEGL